MPPISPNQRPEGKELYAFGPFRVDAEKGALLRAGEPVPLTPKTFQILLVLVRHSQEVVTKDDLMKSVWPDTFVEEANLSRNIFMLRRALGDNSQDRYILTVPGRGYRLAESVQLVREQEISVISANRSKVQLQLKETKSWGWIALFVLIVAAAAVIAFRSHSGPAAVLNEKDTVVLADFTNTTNDLVFDGTLRQGLEVQLGQSPFLSLVPEERIRETLGMMSKPPDTRLTPEIAKEICERTGSAAVLDGSIASLGTNYVVGLRAMDCRSTRMLAQEQTQVAHKEEVLNALSQISTKMRSKLGESLITVAKHNSPLDEATTSSLEALKAYSSGWKAVSATGTAAGIPFFKHAIEIDPNFAMAYASLGRAYGDTGESVLSAKSTSKAYQLRDRTSDAEKFFIDASYEMLVTGNLEKAQQTCEAWAQNYPRDFHPHGFLSGAIYPVFGSYERELEEAKKIVDLDPDFPIGYNILSLAYAEVEDLPAAESTIRRASERKLEIPEFVVDRYSFAFLKNDQQAMTQEVARAQQESGAKDLISDLEAFRLAYSGQLADSRNKSQHAIDLARQSAQQERVALLQTTVALREAFFGNTAKARQSANAALMLSPGREVEYGAGFALALAGDAAHAETLATDLEHRFPEDTPVKFSYVPSIRALVALKRGDPAKAVALLENARPNELGIPPSGFLGFFGMLYPVYVRGEAYLALNRGREAGLEFQKILDHPGIVVVDPIGALSNLQLGRSYLRSGEATKAKNAYRHLFTLWENADTDIPILIEARREYRKIQ